MRNHASSRTARNAPPFRRRAHRVRRTGKLLVERHALELFKHGRARRELLHARLKGAFQIFAHERGAVRSGGNVAVLCVYLANLVDAQKFHVAVVQLAEVIVFEFEVRDCFVNAP